MHINSPSDLLRDSTWHTNMQIMQICLDESAQSTSLVTESGNAIEFLQE